MEKNLTTIIVLESSVLCFRNIFAAIYFCFITYSNVYVVRSDN